MHEPSKLHRRVITRRSRHRGSKRGAAEAVARSARCGVTKHRLLVLTAVPCKTGVHEFGRPRRNEALKYDAERADTRGGRIHGAIATRRQREAGRRAARGGDRQRRCRTRGRRLRGARRGDHRRPVPGGARQPSTEAAGDHWAHRQDDQAPTEGIWPQGSHGIRLGAAVGPEHPAIPAQHPSISRGAGSIPGRRMRLSAIGAISRDGFGLTSEPTVQPKGRASVPLHLEITLVAG